jgi:hypothetical protein
MDYRGFDFCYTDTRTLYLGVREKSGWTYQEIDTSSSEDRPGFSLASGADGSLHLVFANADGLWYEPGPSATAERQLVDEWPAGYGGVTVHGGVSVAIDSEYVHVAYGVPIDGSVESTIWYARRSVPDGVDNDCDGVVW